MTIIAGFNPNRRGSAPLNLAAQIPRCTGDTIIAATIVERPWPPKADPIEDEYLRYVTSQAARSLDRVVSQLAGILTSRLLCTSQPQSNGFDRTCRSSRGDAGGRRVVVVRTAGQGCVGQCHRATRPYRGGARRDRPRGYGGHRGSLHRLTAAYGGEADINGLIPAAAELAKEWSVRLRMVSFTVRPVPMFAGAIETSAEDPVIEQWSHRTFDEIVKQLNAVRARNPDVDVVVGTGHDWREAVENVSWRPATCWRWVQEQPVRWLRYSLARPPRRSCGTLPFR